jgi:hypothetical protein
LKDSIATKEQVPDVWQMVLKLGMTLDQLQQFTYTIPIWGGMGGLSFGRILGNPTRCPAIYPNKYPYAGRYVWWDGYKS